MTTPAYCFFLAAAFLLLPFMKGMTLDIGFPLKAYELLFPFSFMTFFLGGASMDWRFIKRLVLPLLAFWIAAIISTYVMLYEQQGTPELTIRGGPTTDAVFRLAYLLFNILVLIVSVQGANRSPRLLINAWLLGMALAATYSLYCVFSLTLWDEAYMLPGIERHQLSSIGPFIISRSGTFEEGNYNGLYFILSAALAFWDRRPIYLALALVGLILSKSTAAYFAFIVLVFLYFMLRQRSALKALPYLMIASFLAFGLYSYAVYEGKISESSSSSGLVRLNESMTGVNMFLDHPYIGVGVGQYGFRFMQYVWSPSLVSPLASERPIPNNVYVELLAETGLLGFVLFMIFWRNWLTMMKRATSRQKIFYCSGVAMSICWMAYPTYNISYLWCFAGAALAFSNGPSRRPRVPRTLPVPAGAMRLRESM